MTGNNISFKFQSAMILVGLILTPFLSSSKPPNCVPSDKERPLVQQEQLPQLNQTILELKAAVIEMRLAFAAITQLLPIHTDIDKVTVHPLDNTSSHEK
jgi:hypothetical protein